MSQNKKIEIELPFYGFYESIHDAMINDAIESYFNYDYATGDDREITEAEYNAIYDCDIDWQAIRIEYCKEYIDQLAYDVGLGLVYSDMTSPREYNFSTDRLFATIPESQLAELRSEVESYPEYRETIKERFTSRDGFWSFYDADIEHEDWTRPELDACQYEIIMELWLQHNFGEDLQDNIAGDLQITEFNSVDDAINKIEKYLEAEGVK